MIRCISYTAILSLNDIEHISPLSVTSVVLLVSLLYCMPYHLLCHFLSCDYVTLVSFLRATVVLNHYLHVTNRHAIRLCDTCQVQETIEHHLLFCPNQACLSLKLSRACMSLNLPITHYTILNTNSLLNLVYTHLSQAGRVL